MAAAFATYLGPYHHNFRRVMLTVHWPNCLRERGIPLVIDSLDGLKGMVGEIYRTSLSIIRGFLPPKLASEVPSVLYMALELFGEKNRYP